MTSVLSHLGIAQGADECASGEQMLPDAGQRFCLVAWRSEMGKRMERNDDHLGLLAKLQLTDIHSIDIRSQAQAVEFALEDSV